MNESQTKLRRASRPIRVRRPGVSPAAISRSPWERCGSLTGCSSSSPICSAGSSTPESWEWRTWVSRVRSLEATTTSPPSSSRTLRFGTPGSPASSYCSASACFGDGRPAVALICSVPWAVGVWAVGEGFGGMFMQGTSLLTGAPGPALLYGLLALLLLSTSADSRPQRGRLERAGLGVGAAGWALIWTAGALLELEGINHAAAVPGAQIANGSTAEPAVYQWVDRVGGHLIGQHGYLFALVLGSLAIIAGWGIFVPAWRRACLVIGIVVAVFVGLVGQDLGAIFTGQGTDPGSGPLLILLALALWRPRVSSEPNLSAAVCFPARETEVSPCLVGSPSPKGSLPRASPSRTPAVSRGHPPRKGRRRSTSG